MSRELGWCIVPDGLQDLVPAEWGRVPFELGYGVLAQCAEYNAVTSWFCWDASCWTTYTWARELWDDVLSVCTWHPHSRGYAWYTRADPQWQHLTSTILDEVDDHSSVWGIGLIPVRRSPPFHTLAAAYLAAQQVKETI